MNNSELYKKIKTLENIAPNKDWVQNNRSRLIACIKIDKKETTSVLAKISDFVKVNFSFLLDIILPHRFIAVFGRSAVISMIGACIVISGASAVGVSQDKIPGDVLYPVKIATEKVQLAFTSSIEDKTLLEMNFAGRRIDELNKLALQDKLTPNQLNSRIHKATAGLEENIRTVNTHLATLNREGVAKSALLVAKDVDKKVEEYSTALSNINKIASSVEVGEMLNKVEEASDMALEVMVSKNTETDNGISNTEIAKKLNNKIALATGGIDESIENNEIGEVFEDAKSLVKKGEFVAALSKITEGKDIIKELRNQMNKDGSEESDIMDNDEEVDNADEVEGGSEGGELEAKDDKIENGEVIEDGVEENTEEEEKQEDDEQNK